MRKSLFFIFISLSLRLFAQINAYHPFRDTNVVWNQTYSYVVPSFPPVGVQCPDIMYLSGDTVISNITYKKILTSGYCYAPSTCCYHYDQYVGALRQDSSQRKVYFCKDATTKDTLLYDFNLNAGDTLPKSYVNNPWGIMNYVSSVDSIMIGTTYRRQYHISIKGSSSSMDSNYVQLIEGIGSTFGLYAPLAGPPFEAGYLLNCFKENNAVVYTNPFVGSCATVGIVKNEPENFLRIYPNPSSGIFFIDFTGKFKFSVYDIFGMEIFQSIESRQSAILDLSAQPKGIYFLRGQSEDKVFSRKIILQ